MREQESGGIQRRSEIRVRQVIFLGKSFFKDETEFEKESNVLSNGAATASIRGIPCQI